MQKFFLFQENNGGFIRELYKKYGRAFYFFNYKKAFKNYMQKFRFSFLFGFQKFSFPKSSKNLLILFLFRLK